MKISCRSCFEDYSRSGNLPFILPSCGHSYCKKCIQLFIKHPDNRNPRSLGQASIIKCPVDGVETYLSKGTPVESLPKNLDLIDLLSPVKTFFNNNEQQRIISNHLKGSAKLQDHQSSTTNNLFIKPRSYSSNPQNNAPSEKVQTLFPPKTFQTSNWNNYVPYTTRPQNTLHQRFVDFKNSSKQRFSKLTSPGEQLTSKVDQIIEKLPLENKNADQKFSLVNSPTIQSFNYSQEVFTQNRDLQKLYS